MPTKLGATARRIVAARFRIFINQLMETFTTTPSEVMKRAEAAHDSGQEPPLRSP